MPRVFFYSPHPDDETLSAGLALTRWLAAGFDVHLVSMNRGGVAPASIKLDGSGVCGYDGYVHDPAREGYTVPTNIDIAAARLAETRSALGAMATIPVDAGVPAGGVFHHEGGLPDGFGGTYGQPPTQAGIDAAKTVIAQFVADYPNSFHYTMSETDNHPDHAACGLALRQLKNVDPTLVNARFFVSKLYWDYTANPDVAAQPGLAWFSAGPRKAEYDALLRGRVISCFKAWNPAAGSFGIGYHQVVNQFNNCFSTSVNISNLWHS
jgi:LmbE family N-acetylglucosaminyl deacetylase